MTSRTVRKSTTLPVAKIGLVCELPGAVFFGSAIDDAESIAYATRLQQIRSEYENDDCEEMLWYHLSQMGFDPSDIRKFMTNPAAITNCGYYGMPTA